MFATLPFSLALLLSVTSDALAAPQLTPVGAQTINLFRKPHSTRSEKDWGEWAKNQRERLQTKYGSPNQPQKRSSGTNLMTNQNADSSFFGSLAIGTPPISYNVILDTGSSDLWVADSNCVVGCRSVPTFNPSASSTFVNSSIPFQITYGSGRAGGALGKDVVQMAGFSVPNQVFGVCDTVSSGLLSNPVSGLLGLAWQQIASSGATPLWQTLAQSGGWDQPVMAFQLTRFVDNPAAESLEAGGTFTMGAVNTSLFTGDIEYQNIPSGAVSYWILPLTALTVQGKSITLPTGPASYSAIDTGTTLVGGPSDIIASMFAQIPGSAPATGNMQGYFTYPCDTSVTVSMAFGGKTWDISPADFKLTQLSSGSCLGAFFQLTTGSNAPSWIIGDTFLKNVYSVFRFNPPSVGFAQLSQAAISENSGNLPVPTPTIGSAAATVSATGRTRGGSLSGAASMRMVWSGWMMAVGMVAFGACLGLV